MAAATTIIAGATMALGAATTVKGISDTAKANRMINNYDRQDLKNHSEDIQISTAGSDLIREEGARTTNSLVDTVSKGGARAITGNVGRITAANNKYNRRAAVDLDRQIMRRNTMIAQENSRIQSMYERREEIDIAGLSRQLEASKQTTWNGLSTIHSGLMYGANNGMFESERDPVSTVLSEGFEPEGIQGGSKIGGSLMPNNFIPR